MKLWQKIFLSTLALTVAVTSLLSLLFLLSIFSYNKADLAVLDGGSAEPLRNWVGPLGANISRALFYIFGLAVYPVTSLMIICLARGFIPYPLKRRGYIMALCVTILGIVILLALFPQEFILHTERLGIGHSGKPAFALSGGALGALIAAPETENISAGILRRCIGTIGTMVTALCLIFSGLFWIFMQDWKNMIFDAIRGTCDLNYINIPWIKQQHSIGKIADCGNSTTPTLEKIIAIDADAVLISPFQNSGGYGRLDEWGNPIIEMADYMETSPLGRAEWMKFYGLLFGAEKEADSLFNKVEKNYNDLKAIAGKSSTRLSMIIDKVEGPVWYVPGGRSTIGQMIADANAGYAFSDDKSSGSLQLTFETILAKAGNADVWLYRYSPPATASYASLLSEHHGYAQFKAFKERNVYACNTLATTFYEDTPFRPDMLLRDFIIITHPDLKNLGEPKYFTKLR